MAGVHRTLHAGFQGAYILHEAKKRFGPPECFGRFFFSQMPPYLQTPFLRLIFVA